MKKKYIKIICLGITFLGITANAQDFKKYGFGIKAGANASNLNTSDNTPEPFEHDSDPKVGFYVGILGEISINPSKSFAFQPEVMYSQEGYKKSFTMSNNQSNKVDYTLESVKIPLLLKYYIWDQFSVVLGPQFSFFTKQKWDFDNEYVGNESEITSRELKDSDFSVASGFSYNTKSGLSIDFRYNHGAKSIYKNAENITTRNFQLGLSYKF